jgi:hypothetical protein
MPIDASIPLGVKPFQIESPINQLAKVLQIGGMQQDQQMGQMKMDEYRRSVDDQNALRADLSGAGADPYNVLIRHGRVKEATDFAKGKADITKTTADTEKSQLETAHKRIDMLGQVSGWVRQNPTPENAAQAIQHLQMQGVLTPQQAQQEMAKVQADPSPQGIANFADMAFRASLQAKDQLPKLQTNNIGGQTVTQSIDAVTGKPSVVGAMQNTVSPDAQLQANTSTANNQRTINAENLRAGVMPGGGMDENSERTAQAIASGQLPAPTGMALLNPKNQRILGRVMEINPQYDATTVDAKKKAARDFTTGQLGNSMRSFQVAGQHLDQLNTLVDALNNGNMQIVNKIGNAYSSQTGNPAPTNFDAAKDVVSKEVVKAIVAGGGGVTERQELAHLMDNAKSPKQLKGVIQQYRNLMAAQHDALLQQRDAAGLPRSTLPNYNEPGGSPGTSAVPPDIKALLDKHGGK